jgi:hypothetical protein
MSVEKLKHKESLSSGGAIGKEARYYYNHFTIMHGTEPNLPRLPECSYSGGGAKHLIATGFNPLRKAACSINEKEGF